MNIGCAAAYRVNDDAVDQVDYRLFLAETHDLVQFLIIQLFQCITAKLFFGGGQVFGDVFFNTVVIINDPLDIFSVSSRLRPMMNRSRSIVSM